MYYCLTLFVLQERVLEGSLARQFASRPSIWEQFVKRAAGERKRFHSRDCNTQHHATDSHSQVMPRPVHDFGEYALTKDQNQKPKSSPQTVRRPRSPRSPSSSQSDSHDNRIDPTCMDARVNEACELGLLPCSQEDRLTCEVSCNLWSSTQSSTQKHFQIKSGCGR